MKESKMLNLIINPKLPDAINAGSMTKDELHAKLQKRYDDIEAEKVQNAERVFADFR